MRLYLNDDNGQALSKTFHLFRSMIGESNALLTGNLKRHVFAAFLAKKVPL